uniref:Uncharacterized protein n=1 Tax=viral metagenome TaxID=1070528 RepID=A0A6C0BPU2_9ZZZZ
MASSENFKQLLKDIRSTPMVYPRTCDNDYCRMDGIQQKNIAPQWVIVCGEFRMFCCDKCVSMGTWSIRYDDRKVKALLSKY